MNCHNSGYGNVKTVRAVRSLARLPSWTKIIKET